MSASKSPTIGNLCSNPALPLPDVSSLTTLYPRRRIAYVFSFNKLESVFLITATAILLSGMVFESSALAPGSGAFVALTVLVAVLIVGAVALFLGLLSLELYRSCKFAAVSSSATDSLEQALVRWRGWELGDGICVARGVGCDAPQLEVCAPCQCPCSRCASASPSSRPPLSPRAQ